jgi:hypothetical protein
LICSFVADCNLSGSTETVTVYDTTVTAYTTIYVPAPTPVPAESPPAPSESSTPVPVDEPSPEQDDVTSDDLASPAFSAFTAPEMQSFDNSTLLSSQNETTSLLYSLANSTLFTNGSLLFSNGTLLPFFNSTSSPLAGMNGTTDLSSFFNSNGTFIGFEISHNNSDSSALVGNYSTETVIVEAPSSSASVPLPSPMEGMVRRSRVRRERKMHGARRR